MTDITVFIMNYNGMDCVKDCIEAVMTQSMDADVLFMDNHSTDGSADYARKRGLRVWTSNRNRYVAYMEREAIRMCKTKYAAFCHVDCTPEKDWLRKLHTIAQSDKRIGAVEPEVVHYNGQVLHGTLTRWFTPRFVECQPFPTLISTCATLYRIIGIDLFDASFLHYYDETYAGETLKRRGYYLVHDKNCIVKHIGSHAGLVGLRWKALSRFNQFRMIMKFGTPADSATIRISGYNPIKELEAVK